MKARLAFWARRKKHEADGVTASLSLVLAPIDRSVSIPHGETESGHTIVFPIFLLSNVYRRLSHSREGGILDYANDGATIWSMIWGEA